MTDSYYVYHMNACCPLCGKLLADIGWTKSGHFGHTIGVKAILFAACSNHYEEAVAALEKLPDQRAGYQGEWKPEYGLMADVARYPGVETPSERTLVRII